MKHRPGLSASCLSVTSLAGFGLAIATSAASAGAPTSRYWVAPLIGFWDDAGNWSLSDGGPVGGGIPQNDDVVRFTTRSTCLFDGQLGLPIQSTMLLAGAGSGQGRTLLNQSAGLLRCSTIRVGNQSLRNDLKVSGGSLNTSTMYVGDINGEGLLEVSGTGSVGPISSFNVLYVGFSEGEGLVDIRGGLVDFDEVYLSIDSNLGTPGGPAELMMTGGTLTIDEFYVGYGGRGFAQFFGGTATASSCTVGLVGESGALRPQLNVGTGGDLDITGTLTIGDFEEAVGEEPGDGRVLVTGGSLDATLVHVAQDAGTDGELVVDGGFFSATTLRVGRGGDGSVEVRSGQLNASTLEVGDASTGEGRVDLDGGSMIHGTARIGAAPGADGTLVVNGGTLETNLMEVGIDGKGFADLIGGTVDTPLVKIGGSTAHDAYLVVRGGTLLADEIEVEGDMQGLVAEQLFVREGLVVSDELRIAPGADVRFGFGFPFDARVSSIINDGRFDFSGNQSVLSGPLIFGNIRLLGTLVNNGDFNFRSGAPDDAFGMNLVNTTSFEVSPSVRAIVGGAITNRPSGTILVRRDSPADEGRLEARNSTGITNEGTLELDNAIVATPNGSVTNTGTITGFGSIEGDLFNAGQVLPSPADPANDLSVDSLACTTASSIRFVITGTGHNSIAATGDVALDGALNIAFAQGVPLPAGGTEYDLVTTSGGTITGAFASEAILGYPCEIVYEPTRVFARSLRCNAGDFAPPFGILDLADISAFIGAFTGGSPLADLNGDTFLDLTDLGLFITSFTGGCP